MLYDVTVMLTDMVGSIFGLFDSVFSSLDAWGVILGALLTFTACRLLIMPIVGGVLRSGQSDVVKYIRSPHSDNGSRSYSKDNITVRGVK